jgi:hypothetical protein
MIPSASPQVIIRLKGGLGNQLFMYAFAKSMASRNAVPLSLDTVSGFALDTAYRRNYQLHHFPIEEDPDVRHVASPWGDARRKLVERVNRILPLRLKSYVKERVKGFDEEIYRMPIARSTCFDGYWQSYRYFESVEGMIRERLRVGAALAPEHDEETRQIRSCAAVCLAVRRFGDVSGRKKGEMTILDAHYYHRAMRIMAERVASPHFFIFTQDRQWARENIDQERHRVTFIREKDPVSGAVADLALMSLCRHFIISNSTLHWWGAWLNPDPDKVVIAPVQGWVQREILPPAWLRVDCNAEAGA